MNSEEERMNSKADIMNSQIVLKFWPVCTLFAFNWLTIWWLAKCLTLHSKTASWPSSTSTSVFEFKNVTLDGDDDDIIEDDDGSDVLAVVPKLAVYIVWV